MIAIDGVVIVIRKRFSSLSLVAHSLAIYRETKHMFRMLSLPDCDVFVSVGQVMPAAALITLGYLECTQAILAVVILTMAVTLSAPVFSGYVVNHVDIAPPYAGVLFGISNTIAASTGFISPVVTSYLTPNVSIGV